MVPGSLGLGSAVFAAMATLAPSRAALSPIASPMPRDAPVMNRVLPERVSATTGLPIIVERQLLAPAAARGKPEPEKRSCPARVHLPAGGDGCPPQGYCGTLSRKPITSLILPSASTRTSLPS